MSTYINDRHKKLPSKLSYRKFVDDRGVFAGELGQNAFNVLSNFPSNSHVYIPGVGMVSGFTAGNYQNSAGTTAASVDSPVGLVLDGAGSVGSELYPQPSLDSSASLAVGAGWTVSGGVASLNGGVGVLNDAANYASYVTGSTYRITVEIDSHASGGTFQIYLRGASVATSGLIAPGTYTCCAIAGSSTTEGLAIIGITSCAGSITNISVKEITGIHASQATAGYKPVGRRGIVNRLTYSNDLTNAGWEKLDGGSVSTDAVGNLCNSTVRKPLFITSGAKTAAFEVRRASSGSASSIRVTTNNTAAWDTGTSTKVTLTDEWQTVVATITANDIYAMVGKYDASGNIDASCVGNFYVRSGGLFQGTLTAAQIQSYGGIPLTTTAAASSVNGPYYLEHVAWNQSRLLLGSIPFQMADDFAIVAAFKIQESSAAWRTMFGMRNSAGAARIQFFCTNGSMQAFFRDDASANLTLNSTVNSFDQIAIGTLHKVGNTVSLRLNGVSKATNTLSLGVATFNSAAVGNLGDQSGGTDNYHGALYPVLPIKGTLSDADIAILENQAAALAGGRLVGGNFVSNY